MRTTRVAWALIAASLLALGARSQNVVFKPGFDTTVFADGFESGDPTAWSSATQPILTVPPYVDISQIAGLWWPYCDSGDCPWEPPTQLHDGLDFTPIEDLVPFQASAPGDVIGRLVQGQTYAHVQFGIWQHWQQTCPERFLSYPVNTELRDLVQRDKPTWEICN